MVGCLLVIASTLIGQDSASFAAREGINAALQHGVFPHIFISGFAHAGLAQNVTEGVQSVFLFLR